MPLDDAIAAQMALGLGIEQWLGALQWPAMLATVLASWLVASRSPLRRRSGFWVFLGSNVLWTVWGWHTQSWALVVLQACLVAMNLRGAKKNDEEVDDDEAQED